MTSILLDTNALISFLTDRDEVQQARADALFRDAAERRADVILHQTVVTETVYVLTNLYGRSSSEVAGLLRDLLAMPGVVTLDDLAWPDVLDRWPDPYPDLADACLASVASRQPIDAVATFDRRFARQLRREGVESFW